jgi:hypothetical protein
MANRGHFSLHRVGDTNDILTFGRVPLAQQWKANTVVVDSLHTEGAYHIIAIDGEPVGFVQSGRGQYGPILAKPGQEITVESINFATPIPIETTMLAVRYDDADMIDPGAAIASGVGIDVPPTPEVPSAVTTKQNGVINTVVTDVWVPAAGKAIRLLGYTMSVTANRTAAVAANVTLKIYEDGVATGLAMLFHAPGAANVAIGDTNIAVTLGPQGRLWAINAKLQMKLDTALTNGFTQLCVWGQEE